MVGQHYSCPDSKRVYRVITEVRTKGPDGGEWVPRVIFTDGDSTYCLSKKDFLNKYKLIKDG